MKKLLSLIACAALRLAAPAQPTVAFGPGLEQQGDVACIDVRVQDFTDIVSMEFSLQWENAGIEFTNVRNFNLPGLGIGNFGLSQAAAGSLSFSWAIDDCSLPGPQRVTLPDSTSIFQVCLRRPAPCQQAQVALDVVETPVAFNVTRYQALCTNIGLVPAGSAITIQEDCRSCDSLALAAIYNATGGPGWANNTNWLAPGQPISSWYGVTANGEGCVSELMLMENGLSGSLPGFSLSALEKLWLGGNQLTGALPDFNELPQLVELSLPNNQFSGPIPEEIGNLSRLTLLNIGTNQLTGSLPPQIGNLSNLVYLILDRNNLSGSLPPELGNLANLLQLNLVENGFSGSIPAELWNLANLDIFALANNNLTGAIPAEVQNLVNLTNLSISSNQLSGNIPPEIGNLANLRAIYLSNNQLSGPLPPEIGNLVNLGWLNLNANELSGPIPPELANLTNINLLYLYNNDFSGCFSPELSALCSRNVDFSQNPGLPGGGDFDAFCAGGAGSCSTCDPLRDSLALVALYNATGGPGWSNSWSLGQPMSTWYGVFLNSEGCVECLDLDALPGCEYSGGNGIGMTGALPPEIGNLLELKELDLSRNGLSGGIPPEIGNLVKLERINFNGVPFGGSIPPEVGNLSLLRSIWMPSCQLTGPLPPEIGNLAALEEMYIFDNQLSGNLPGELGNLGNLEHLNIHVNQFSGNLPASLGNLAALQEIWLHTNQLSGPIPKELGSLINLRSINLHDNQLSGAVPPELGGLPALTELKLQNNSLSGCFPQELANHCDIDVDFSNNPGLPGGGDFDAFCASGAGSCSACDPLRDSLALVALYNATGGPGWGNNTNWLEPGQPIGSWYGVTVSGNGCVICLDLDGNFDCELSGNGNNLVGVIPPEIGNLTELVFLSLFNNQLSGTIPPALGDLLNLEALFLRFNNLNGEIPIELLNLANLTRLSLRDNNLSGNIPSGLGNLANLTELDLSYNEFTGFIPSELGSLTNLKKLWLNNNQFSGSLPLELGNLTNLVILDLSYNTLSGNIPRELGNLTGLTDLWLNSNQFNGILPPEFGNLVNLTDLDLSFNEISGNIPAEIGNLNNLLNLSIHGNQLTGPLPEELGNLTNLIRFVVRDNQLSGNVPAWIGNFSNLLHLRLDNNQFSGPIPAELGNLTNLSDFILQRNNLSGCFPPELANHCNINSDFSNNPLLPWQGDFSRFCMGEAQLGAPCNDGDDETTGEVIQADCSCSPGATCPTGTVVIVTNTDDNGPGSLRQALECANTDPTLDTILFEIPGAGPHIITLLSALPALSDEGIVIDGLSQDGNIGSIVLDGNGVVNDGLYLAAGQCTVKGIKARNFNSSGFIIFDVNNCILDQNCTVSNFYGIFLGRGSLCNGHAITNNLIGVEENGDPGPNTYGVQIFACSDNLFEDNTIAYNSLEGLGYNGGGNEGNQIIQGSFYCNVQGISTSQAINVAPSIGIAQTDIIQGTTDANETVAVYRQDNSPCGTAACQGSEFLGVVTADAGGNWTLSAPFPISLAEGSQITATTTTPDGSTSPFSVCVPVVAGPCLPPVIVELQDTICAGELYTIAGLSYGQTGQYRDTLRYGSGCDSLVVGLSLVVLDESTLGAATAVADEPDCEGRAFLSGNLPPLATGRWESGSGATVESPATPSTAVSGLPVGESAFSWILSAGECPDYDSSMVRLLYLGAPQLQDDEIEAAFTREGYEMDVLANDEWQDGDDLLVLEQPSTGQAVFGAGGKLVFTPGDFAAGAREFSYALCRDGCCDTARVVLLIERPVGFPDAITPNGDGYNDFFVIQPLFESPATFPDNRLLIFDRAGILVFEASPYGNDWDGRSQSGRELPEGPYYFIYEAGDGSPKVTGRIAVLR